MATRPATAPEQIPTTVGLPFSAHSTSIQVKAATAVAIWVTSMAMPACMPALTAEPALVNSDAAGKAWFFKMKIADQSELDGLMDEAAYKAHTA